MKRISFLAMMLLVIATFSGCMTIAEAPGFGIGVYGNKEEKVALNKVSYYRLVYYRSGLLRWNYIDEKVIIQPNETQKKVADYFIQAVKERFKGKDVLLVEDSDNSKKESVEIGIASLYLERQKGITQIATRWMLGKIEIRQFVVVLPYFIPTNFLSLF